MRLVRFALVTASILCPRLQSARLKDLVSIEGIRDNQIIGYGLVVGLNGTGDKKQTVFPAQSLTNLLARMGISVSPTAISVKNTAAVMLTANLPPFAQPGSKIDISVSAIGDCSNLQGGILVLSPLRAADGQTYAVAQGSVVTGGFSAGKGGNTQTVNHPTSGRVPSGGIVERAAPSVSPGSVIRLQLRQADFTTSTRISQAINRRFGTASAAHSESSGVVTVNVPQDLRAQPVEFVSLLENVVVDADQPARIVVNERTGTIVMGKDVRISPVAILHGGLTVEIQTTVAVSQPNPFAGGQTVPTPDVKLTAKEDKAKSIVLRQGASVEELVRAMMAIGSTPRDIIAILQALRASGALEAELEVI